MNVAVIRELAQLLPADCAFFTKKLGPMVATPAARLEACLSEPSFGYCFVMHHLSTGMMLPASVTEMPLIRAYNHRQYGNPDEAVEGAFALEHPACDKRPLLRALLVCNDISSHDIAQALSIPEEVLSIYDALFFNVRDRLKDGVYLHKIVFPETRLSRIAPDAGKSLPAAQKLLQTGYEHGSQEVLYLAGFLRQRNGGNSVKDLVQKLEATLYGAALTEVRTCNLEHADSPALKAAKSLLIAEKRRQESIDVSQHGDELMQIGLAEGVLDTVKAIQAADIEKRLACSTGKLNPAGE